MATYYIGQIVLFAGSYAPDNFLPCDGRTVSVSAYQALYALIGNTYGGDPNNFALPDLRSRIPLGRGQGVTDPKNGGGAVLINYPLGQKGGAETITLTQDQIPAHTHAFKTGNTAATTNDPTGAALANVPSGTALYIADTPGGPTPTTLQLGTQAVTSAGGATPHSNIMPSMPLTYIICVQGLFPTQQ
jgi:microcystin-dependent protein